VAKALVNPRSVYTWDPKSLRYRASNGQFVQQQAIKQALNTFVARVQKEIERLAGQVASGRIPVDEWQRLTANLVKSSHLASAAAAKGGWAQMTPADNLAVARGLKFQYTRLRKFAGELARLTPGDIVNRSGMYARSAAGAYEQARFDTYAEKVRQGAKVRMRNRLSKTADHCKPRDGRPGCVEETSRGWVAFGTMSLPGQRACLTKCKCTLEYDVVSE
jgi:hypothetical protein